MSDQKPFAVLTSRTLEYFDDGGGDGCHGNFTILCGGPVLLTAEAIKMLCPTWMTSRNVVMLAEGRFDNATAFVPKGTVGRLFRVSMMARGMDRLRCAGKLASFLSEVLRAHEHPVTIGTMLDTRDM